MANGSCYILYTNLVINNLRNCENIKLKLLKNMRILLFIFNTLENRDSESLLNSQYVLNITTK